MTTATSESTNLEPKAVVIDGLNKLAMSSPVVLAMEYRGLSANDMAELRSNAREAGVTVRIAKNTLARRAFAGSPYDAMSAGMTGPLMLLFSSEENISGAAKVCRDYAGKHDCLQIRMLSLQNNLLDVSATAKIADLPTHEQAVARLLGLMLAPVTQLARLLKMPVVQLLCVLGEIRKNKETG